MPSSARAESIGSAATARNDVSREAAQGAVSDLAAGGPVYRDDSVRTGADSAAKLVFRDSTNLSVGPTARVKLDKFVYDSDPSAQSVAVKMAKGAFRFSTGAMDKKAYDIETPTAAIGVRGTILDISVTSGRTRVTLVEGRALVCPLREGEDGARKLRDCWPKPGKKSPCDCIELDQKGRSASSNGAKAAPAATPFDFSPFCGADPSLCSRSDFADLGPTGGDALCGR